MSVHVSVRVSTTVLLPAKDVTRDHTRLREVARDHTRLPADDVARGGGGGWDGGALTGFDKTIAVGIMLLCALTSAAVTNYVVEKHAAKHGWCDRKI
jgi:hypothetical protein